MDLLQLQRALSYLTGSFAEVYTVARDYVHNIKYNGKNLVIGCNTGDSWTYGEHWVIIITYRVGQQIVSQFYDSFGRRPEYYNIKYLYPITRYNKIQHQNINTTFCGVICIYFVYIRFLRRCAARRVYKLGRNRNKNERAAVDFYHRLQRRMRIDPSPIYKCRFYGCFPHEAPGWK